MQVRWLVLGVLVSCGGSEFQPLVVSTLPDAGPTASEVQVDGRSILTPIDAGSDLASRGDAPGSVEASSDAGLEATSEAGPDAPADSETRDTRPDSWPNGEPWCPDSEFYPVFSDTCYTWGMNHGWTLMGCCLPDHTCGTAYGMPATCHR